MNLKEDPLITIEVFADQDVNLMGIFYQDNSMKQLLAAFPEVLFVDATRTQSKRTKNAVLYFLFVMEMGKVKLLQPFWWLQNRNL